MDDWRAAGLGAGGGGGAGGVTGGVYTGACGTAFLASSGWGGSG